jgi:hypothetical protein
MGMMGQGLAEVGANIGRTIQSGYQALGQGIASGIEQAGKEVEKYKTAKTSNDIYRSMIQDPEYGKILGLDPKSEDYEQRKSAMLKGLDDTIKAHGQLGGAQFSQTALGAIQQYANLGRQYQQQLELAKTQAQYNPAWSEVDAKNNYYYALAEQARRKAEYGGKDVSTFFTNTPAGTPTSNQVTPSGEVLSVPPIYEGNLPLPEKQKPYRMQLGLPTQPGGVSMGLLGQ